EGVGDGNVGAGDGDADDLRTTDALIGVSDELVVLEGGEYDVAAVRNAFDAKIGGDSLGAQAGGRLAARGSVVERLVHRKDDARPAPGPWIYQRDLARPHRFRGSGGLEVDPFSSGVRLEVDHSRIEPQADLVAVDRHRAGWHVENRVRAVPVGHAGG